MYDPRIVEPMRKELTDAGFVEMKSAAEVDEVLGKSTGTTLCVVNSVCGCAAGGARPGALLALKQSASKRPSQLTTVFAGQDKEATEHLRSKYLVGYPPSSPAMAILKDGKVVHLIERQKIEGHSPQDIAQQLQTAFEKWC